MYFRILAIRIRMTMDWNHLRTFEAVVRAKSLTEAAKMLSVSQSTVSRHLQQLEAAAGTPLWHRGPTFELTRRGKALYAAMAPMVSGALAAFAALKETQDIEGEVTLTTVPELARWLIPHLESLYRRHPGLQLRILAENRVQSLAAQEADLAVRMARPDRGDLLARRLATLDGGYYAAASLVPDPSTPWLGLTGSLANIPEQRHAERAFGQRRARLWVEDLEALVQATAEGLGVAVLPRGMAERHPALVEVPASSLGLAVQEPIPQREVWAVVHRSKRALPAIDAVWHWLAEPLASPSDS